MVLTHLGKTFFISWFTEATYFKQDEMMDWKEKMTNFVGTGCCILPKNRLHTFSLVSVGLLHNLLYIYFLPITYLGYTGKFSAHHKIKKSGFKREEV